MKDYATGLLLAIGVCVVVCSSASAQEAEPRIGPFVLDIHGTFPSFPDNPQLAESRGLNRAELPGVGLGIDVGLHLYLLRWRAITFGIGGEAMVGRSRRTQATAAGQSVVLRPVTEKLQTVSPQLSFNFGTGKGWSYVSGGIGATTWSISPDGREAFSPDSESLKTINYGGGARWFSKRHVAFSFDVRFWVISPSTPVSGLPPCDPLTGCPSSPRTKLIVLGAGISLK